MICMTFITTTSPHARPIPQIVDELTCAALTHARLVLTISKEAIADFFSRIPPCVDHRNIIEYPCLPTPAECEALKKAAPSRHDDFTACYFGNLAWDRGVLEIIDAVQGMEGCRLLLAGPELEKGILSHCLAHAGGCTRISYLGYLMREDLLAHTARCHCIVLLLMPDNRHHRYRSPISSTRALSAAHLSSPRRGPKALPLWSDSAWASSSLKTRQRHSEKPCYTLGMERGSGNRVSGDVKLQNMSSVHPMTSTARSKPLKRRHGQCRYWVQRQKND